MKKLIALFLIFSMLVPLTPAVAADKAETRPTVDDILSEYQQKAFEIDMANMASSSTYSMRSVQSKDELIQETVNTLNSAGYEAYHVTSNNYDSLEAQMRTDFADMGLDPDGSYIIVISGEDPDDASSNSRAKPILPAPDPGEDEDQTFVYTYEGKYYTMRYVTVLANDNLTNNGYRKSDSVEIEDHFGSTLFSNIADTVISMFLDDISENLYLGTLLSIMGLSTEYEYKTSDSTLAFHAAASWNRTFIQVKNQDANVWFTGSMVEYADIISYASGLAFNMETNTFDQVIKNEEVNRVYSMYYDNTVQQKIQAVIGYRNQITQHYMTGSIHFKFGGDVVITFTEHPPYLE